MTERKKPGDWESWVDQQIREAQERGAFDNLPGRGQCLDLTPNPYAPDQELAFKILKDAGFAPEWIEQDKAIRSRLARARQVLARQWDWHQARMGELAGRTDSWSESEKERALAGWERAMAGFEQEIAAINAEITSLNLKVPASRFQRTKIDPLEEVRRLQEGSA
jgi:DnaJ homolog subfamily C member 28